MASKSKNMLSVLKKHADDVERTAKQKIREARAEASETITYLTERAEHRRFTGWPSRSSDTDFREIRAETKAVELSWEPALIYVDTIRELLPFMKSGTLTAAQVVTAAFKARDQERHEQREDARNERRAEATETLARATVRSGEAIQKGLYAIAIAIAASGGGVASAIRRDTNARSGRPTGSLIE